MTSDLRDTLQSLFGQAYAIDREIGGGGMSRVFLAEDTALGRKVVIKVLSPEQAAGISADRFQREVKLAASLQQANIVPLLAAGDSQGIAWYTMPYVDGESLRARLEKGGALPVAEVVSIVRDVTRALAYAHERGVVHRDIKPDNVLLSGGAAVVTDFGIAKAIAAARPQGSLETLTLAGMTLGTPAYMAPEQVAGDPVDGRADLYSLGCMAFELLTRRLPFHGRSSQQMLAAHLAEAPPRVGDIRGDCPPHLSALIGQLLEKNPDARPSSATDVMHALEVGTPSLKARSTSDFTWAKALSFIFGPRVQPKAEVSSAQASRAVSATLSAESINPRAKLVEGEATRKRGDADGAERCFAAALAAAHSDDVLAEAHGGLATVHLMRCEFTEALAHARESARIASGLDDKLPYAKALNTEALVHRQRGHFELAAPLLDRVLAATRDPEARAIALMNLGAIAGDNGDVASAEKHFAEAYGCYQRCNNLRGEAMALQNYGRAAFQRGDVALANELLPKAIAVAEEAGDGTSKALATMNHAEVVGRLGDLARAEALASKALDYFERTENKFFQVESLRLLGDLNAKSGRRKEARRRYEEGLQLARSIDARIEADTITRALDALSR